MPSAAILAGGRSRRFDGRDKSALPVDGRTILDRQLEALFEITDDVMIVGGRPDRARTVRHIADRVAGQGPLGGLDTALAASRAHEVVVVACDMPFVTGGFLAHLLSLAPGHDAVVPRTEHGYHPLCAVYTRSCAAAVSLALAEGRLAVQALLKRLRVREVTSGETDRYGPHRHLLANINTPAEFDELEALPGHKL